MEVKKNIYKNFIAAIFGKFGQIAIRLFQVPILINYLGTEGYGTWILISSIPSWLSISNLGFGNVAGNDAALASGENNIQKIEKVYSSVLYGLILLSILLIFIVLLILYIFKWVELLNINFLEENDLKIILFILSSTVVLSFFTQIVSIKYRVSNNNHRGIWIGNLRPWIDFLFLWLMILLDFKFIGIASSGLIGILIYLVILILDTNKNCRYINVSIKKVDNKYAVYLIKKGIVFQAFPIGNALQNQGYIMVVNHLLGPVAVTLFTTLRTLVRSANQVMELVNQSIWPELSFLLGAKRMREARDVYDKSIKISGVAALAIVIVLLAFGPFLYSFWLGKAVEVNRELLIWFILPIPLTAWWFTSSVVLMASNLYEGYAVRYVSISLVGLLVAWGLGYEFGMPGIAISLAVIDLFMIWYVRGASMRLIN